MHAWDMVHMSDAMMQVLDTGANQTLFIACMIALLQAKWRW